MIKVLVCDGKGTLQFPSPSDEIRELVATLPKMGVRLAVASNSNTPQPILDRFDAAGLPRPALVATRREIGKSKPSPAFIEYISSSLGVAPNEIVYLGDDDNTDIFCAINAGILPISARYSTDRKPREYGLPFTQPGQVLRYLRKFGNQEAPYFGWEFYKQGLNVDEPARVYALIGNHSGWFTSTLKSVLKQHRDLQVVNRERARHPNECKLAPRRRPLAVSQAVSHRVHDLSPRPRNRRRRPGRFPKSLAGASRRRRPSRGFKIHARSERERAEPPEKGLLLFQKRAHLSQASQ